MFATASLDIDAVWVDARQEMTVPAKNSFFEDIEERRLASQDSSLTRSHLLLSLAPAAVVSAADTAAAVTPTDPRQLQWKDNCVYSCPNEAWPSAERN